MRYGHFDNEKREYVIDRVDLPTSWTNYLGVKDTCVVVNHTAGGYMFYKTPEYHRVTRFRGNSVPMDRPGHYVYVRDNDNGDYFSISWQPVGKPLDKAKYKCRHGLSYSVYECEYDKLKASQKLCVPIEDDVELWDVVIENTDNKPRNLSIFSYCEFSFHHIMIDNQNFQMSLYCAGSSYKDGIILYDLFYEEFGYQYFTSNFSPDGFDCLRDKFLGLYHTEDNPQAVINGQCTGSFEKGNNHCGSLQKNIVIQPGEKVRLIFMLGEGNDTEGRRIREKYSDFTNVDKAYKNLEKYWNDKINKLNDIKGIYTYVYNEVDLKERWRVENIIASIDKDNVIKGSFESKIEDIISENKRPTIGFYLDDKSVYKSNETNSGENNKNIRLTIDKSITEKIRNVLKSDEFNNLDNVGVVLLESKSGKIRAMVQKDESEANINLGIGQLGFEPGSIFKILTEAIALNEGLINVTDTFYCGGSICNNNGKPYAHGALTVSKAFELSCNDIYAKIGNLIGYENMLKYTTNLGLFNKVLGVSGENREEASGVMPKATDGISNFAIGQCVTVTPLQIAGAINAVVNDGVYIKPSIIEDIVDDNNNIIESEQNKENRIFLSEESHEYGKIDINKIKCEYIKANITEDKIAILIDDDVRILNETKKILKEQVFPIHVTSVLI